MVDFRFYLLHQAEEFGRDFHLVAVVPAVAFHDPEHAELLQDQAVAVDGFGGDAAQTGDLRIAGEQRRERLAKLVAQRLDVAFEAGQELDEGLHDAFLQYPLPDTQSMVHPLLKIRNGLDRGLHVEDGFSHGG